MIIRQKVYLMQLLCLLIFSPLLHAQDIVVREIPSLDKLPVNAIHRIFQDSDGYMWYGTFNGLCRNDGYNIRVFRSDLYHPGLLSDNYITYISEDHDKKIWFRVKNDIKKRLYLWKKKIIIILSRKRKKTVVF